MFDWALSGGPRPPRPTAMLNDETLRDGLQCPSVTDPPDDSKVAILRLMDQLGIETANIGLPGSGPRQQASVHRLCQAIAEERLRITANCAARTVVADIEPILEARDRTGVPIETCLFIGSSPIRQYAEEWDLDFILRRTVEAVTFAVQHGLTVMYVTEDTVRTRPEVLGALFGAALDAGASRLCLCDTAGSAEPMGVRNLVQWTRRFLADKGLEDQIGLDWHGHRDRGLDLANSLAALAEGVTRVHGTALGLGERVGNTPVELLLVNLRLLGWRADDLTRLPEYLMAVAQATGVEIPATTPIAGTDAFRTATGVHAAAVMKARRRGADWLADRIYSGVPAGWLGRTQEIEVGHMSGASNVTHYLSARGLPSGPAVVAAVLSLAKQSSRLLTEAEVRAAAAAALDTPAVVTEP